MKPAVFPVYRTANPSMNPMPPIKLMRALPLLRTGAGVISGISATTGARYSAIITLKQMMTARKGIISAINGAMMKKTAAPIIPIVMRGIRRPNRLCNRSERAPKNGWMGTAMILSNVIKNPIISFSTGPSPRKSFRIKGI
ncbi:MAG: hypothetical protein RBG13Loki_3606 [Promethearchaeota archaeon CR_4]|nr:MAG: hypothetical protein RBG13Loki_3606 [Candidatus Lokiarchaeota archaeon CR_4]